MRDRLKKGLALGIGLAVASKEQIEKTVDELVKKGELSQQESKEYMDELWKKAEETKGELDAKLQEKIKHVLADLNVATKAEVKVLEQRIRELEEKINTQG
ncbi:phasin family protein [Halalkalibacter sp. APA_J-10(15)]|uniref:phasin family protein n=1 Tax=unclassified Halalkalibacter TaxID=2893063 RepID=UPI001FF35755|nr:phasin family protein [Halalkalibacter sp. APA_J-10(15)]MCK0472856.1 phasin family protein [Halalkalibacter sp. APA_J-10(15)]